ncbi:UNVERIFIED_CONTAM: DHHC zinc finger domain-containing protein [Hammondia hammondi]|eukprot:XP_008884754.1 DHHC zinc finger domain-containing protein [Hammondia hammondi]
MSSVVAQPLLQGSSPNSSDAVPASAHSTAGYSGSYVPLAPPPGSAGPLDPRFSGTVPSDASKGAPAFSSVSVDTRCAQLTQTGEEPAANKAAANKLNEPGMFCGAQATPIGAFEALFAEAARRRQPEQFMGLVRQLILVSGAKTSAVATSVLTELTVLHHACFLGDVSVVKQLISEYHMDPEARHPLNDDTPIFFAARNAHFEVVRFLVNLVGPQCLAAQSRTCMTPFLATASATHDERPHELLKILEFMYLHGVSLEEQNSMGYTALFLAAKHGNPNIVQWLVARGASMNHRDHTGGTVLHAAVAKTGGFSAEDDPLQFLCEHGAVKLIDTRADIGIQFETMRDRPWTGSSRKCPGMTVLQRCLLKRQWFSYLLLLTWRLQYQLFGYTRALRSSYASLYWTITLCNLPLFFNAFCQLHALDLASWDLGALWIVLWGLTQLFWWKTYSGDAGIAPGSKNLIKDQYESIHPVMTPNILDQIPPPSTLSAIGPNHYRLLQLEREQLRLNLELQELRRTPLPFQTQEGLATAELVAGREEDTRILVTALKSLRGEVVALMSGVAIERRKRVSQEYLETVLNGPPTLKGVCVTCAITKTPRIHHCADCGHCLERQDHHCVWVDTCIARNNFQPFWFFLLCLTCLLVWHEQLLLRYCAHLFLHFNQLLWMATSVGAGMLNCMALVFVVYLLVRTTRVMFTNVTYYEFLKKPEHIRRRFMDRTSGWLWDFRGLSFVAMIRNAILFWRNSDLLDEEYTRPVGGHVSGPLPRLPRPSSVSYLPLTSSTATAIRDGNLEASLLNKHQAQLLERNSKAPSFYADPANFPLASSSVPGTPLAEHTTMAPPSRVPSAVYFPSHTSTAPAAGPQQGYQMLPSQPLYMTSDASTATSHPGGYAPNMHFVSPVNSTKTPPSPAEFLGSTSLKPREQQPLHAYQGDVQAFSDLKATDGQQFFSYPISAATQAVYAQSAAGKGVF